MKISQQYIYPMSKEIIEIEGFYPPNKPTQLVRVKYVNGSTKHTCEHPIDKFKELIEKGKIVTI